MPIYDFRCKRCDATFERLVRGATAPVCPMCGSSEGERLFPATVVHSEVTRAAVHAETRRRDAARARDRVHEQRRYERNHD